MFVSRSNWGRLGQSAFWHQDMSLVLANINNFIKYGRSKGAKLLKFNMFYYSFRAAEFAQQIIIQTKPKLQMSCASKT